jgi:exodeoxyribonuclease VII small subunit
MPKITFEKAMEQLEQIVHYLESGELALEEALKKFEDGMKLSRICSDRLEESEKRISILMEKGEGSLEPRPYDVADE